MNENIVFHTINQFVKQSGEIITKNKWNKTASLLINVISIITVEIDNPGKEHVNFFFKMWLDKEVIYLIRN